MNEPLIHNLDFQGIDKKVSFSEKRTDSMFESSWLRIQESFENMRKDETIDEEKEVKDFLTKKKKKKDKNKKGKNIEFQDKLSSADIKDWKEQKLHIASFMEYLKTLFKEEKSEDLIYSFGNHLEIPNSISCDISHLEENDHKFQKMDITLKNNIDNYGNIMADYYIKKVRNSFLIKGLTNEEVERRKSEYGLNELPEKKKTPEIIKYLKEITNVFSNLLWIAAILAFIGYSLDTSDKSNVSS